MTADTRTMVRLVVVGVLMMAVMVGRPVAGWSAPEATGEVIEATCDGTDLQFLRSNGSSGWGIEDGQLDGTKYHLAWLEVYFEGDLVFSKTWGQRTGHGEPLSCTATLDDPRLRWVFAVTRH